MSDQELDDIINGLKTDQSMSTLAETPSSNGNDDNINQFIIDKMTRLVENGMDTIESLQQTVVTGFEPEELSAFSSLIQSVIKAADTLNKINISNKKAKTDKELKILDVETKKHLSMAKGGNTTNVLVATREEIIQKFLTAAKKEAESAVIEVESSEFIKPEEPK